VAALERPLRSFDTLKGISMRTFRWIAVCVLSLFLCGTTSTVQADDHSIATPSFQIPDASHAEPTSLSPQIPTEKAPKSDAEVRAERQLEKERQKQRWQDIRKRSEQLLEIATELKQYVDKSGENVMSIEVIRKAEQMEKLSKDLQRKMKGD
jgi:hypothetical protein